MDAVVYPNRKVIDYLSNRVVPLRLGHEAQPFAEQFKVKWTPRLFLLDDQGESHHDGLGFFSPPELLTFLDLGQGKFLFNTNHLETAADLLDQLVRENPACGSAPEAVYLRGVARFKQTHDASHLKEVNRILAFDYPMTMWANRGFPYWNL